MFEDDSEPPGHDKDPPGVTIDSEELNFLNFGHCYDFFFDRSIAGSIIRFTLIIGAS